MFIYMLMINNYSRFWCFFYNVCRTSLRSWTKRGRHNKVNLLYTSMRNSILWRHFSCSPSQLFTLAIHRRRYFPSSLLKVPNNRLIASSKNDFFFQINNFILKQKPLYYKYKSSEKKKQSHRKLLRLLLHLQAEFRGFSVRPNLCLLTHLIYINIRRKF